MRGQSTAARTCAAIAESRASRLSRAGAGLDARTDEQRIAVGRVLQQPVHIARAHVAGAPAERAIRPVSVGIAVAPATVAPWWIS